VINLVSPAFPRSVDSAGNPALASDGAPGNLQVEAA